jgi:hypothetical protein
MDRDLIQHVSVPKSRLAAGTWKGERETGEGDIHASYSADLISMSGKIRKPFKHGAYLWACVGIIGRGDSGQELEAYRLTPAALFPEPVTSYNAKVAIHHGDAARNDPKGFYHGMAVKHGGLTYVLTGPPSLFIADAQTETPAPAQLDLFGGEAQP